VEEALPLNLLNRLLKQTAKERRKSLTVRDILTEVDNMDLLDKLQKAYSKLKKEIAKEETINKEEILTGIDAGLKEMLKRKRGGRKAKSLGELIDEL
jgi:hypothetical protein